LLGIHPNPTISAENLDGERTLVLTSGHPNIAQKQSALQLAQAKQDE